jgi:hypothetical protein
MAFRCLVRDNHFVPAQRSGIAVEGRIEEPTCEPMSRVRRARVAPSGYTDLLQVSRVALNLLPFYEAVAPALAEFREDPLIRHPPAMLTEFTVAVLKNPTEHKIRLHHVNGSSSASIFRLIV